MRPNLTNNAITTEIFSKDYPFINEHIVRDGEFDNSRVGKVREVIDFKTTVTNPYAKCVGNNSRGINVFFLIAEAMWIFKGDKDLKLLDIFNSRMKDFSDDGKTFHAPYGFRLRHHGVSSFDNPDKIKITENNQHAMNAILNGEDQIREVLHMLKVDSNTRRAVGQIWNSDLDLATDTKDVPCNDLIFFKIRDGKMRTTISNRSNDLHWGLPTNIFQFSFLTETMSQILDVELGTQTHNSHSLHVYTDNPTTFNMFDSLAFNDGRFEDLYDSAEPMKMNINFSKTSIDSRLSEIDYWFGKILDSMRNLKRLDDVELENLLKFSFEILIMYNLMWIYANYKYNTKRQESDKMDALISICGLDVICEKRFDMISLAQNWFYSKLKDKSSINSFVEERLITKASL